MSVTNPVSNPVTIPHTEKSEKNVSSIISITAGSVAVILIIALIAYYRQRAYYLMYSCMRRINAFARSCIRRIYATIYRPAERPVFFKGGRVSSSSSTSSTVASDGFETISLSTTRSSLAELL